MHSSHEVACNNPKSGNVYFPFLAARLKSQERFYMAKPPHFVTIQRAYMKVFLKTFQLHGITRWLERM